MKAIRFITYFLIAVTMLSALAWLMPSNKFIEDGSRLVKASWQSKTNPSIDIPVRTGFRLYGQFGDRSLCCEGTYKILIKDPALLKRFRDLRNPVIYIPAIGGEVSIRLNGEDMSLPKDDYSSVGPVLHIAKHHFLLPNFYLEIELSGVSTEFHGIWKRPPVIGEYFDVLVEQSADRFYQVTIPYITGTVIFIFGIIFLFVYFVTDRQFPYYMYFGVALILESIFSIYLAGMIRSINLQFGSLTHNTTRCVSAFSSFLIILSCLTIFERRSIALRKEFIKLTLAIHLFLALIVLFFHSIGYWITSVAITAFIGFFAFWPLLTWQQPRLSFYSLEFWIYSICCCVALGTLADSTKLFLHSVQVELPYSYYHRYTSAMFCIAALFTFFSHFVVVFRSQKEEQLRRAKAEAVAGTVRMLAHDVRKPFSTLRAGMTMISNATIDDKTRVTARVANELERNLKNVNRMILDVMDFGSNRPMNTETANLSSLVNDCYQDLQMDCEARGILLERQITEDILGTFDVLKVKRALSNILQNAIEATPKGLRITVKLEEIAAGKVISVCNEGSYIEKEGLSKVFDEFYTKHKPYGSGLGLTIAKEFIEAQGGKLYCESDIAKGTTFYIVMPYPEK